MTPPMPQLLTIAVADIAPSPDNTRLFDKKDTDERQSLIELAASIRALGLQQPVRVRPSNAGTQQWTLIYGERRLRAVRDILKWPEITAIIDETVSRDDAAAATVVENLQRRDLHPMDQARGIALLRGQGQTIKQIGTRLGRREDWIKERLKLCDLPSTVQDIYRRSDRMTLQQALGLHVYTHGGKDNTGFPDLMIALATGMDTGTNPSGYLGGLLADNPALGVSIHHAYHDDGGRWAGHYFNTKATCTRCPFAAYRPGGYEGVGFCLLPSHYQELTAKGQKKYDHARATAVTEAAARGEDPTPLRALTPAPTKTAAQKGKDTRARHLQQKAGYAPNVAAIERVIALIPAVESIDLAVFCAYTLTSAHVDHEAIEHVITRHGLTSFPEIESTPTKAQIERLREIEPLALVRYTLEALLLTQARRLRDYDPGKSTADPVLALYLPGQAVEVTEGAA